MTRFKIEGPDGVGLVDLYDRAEFPQLTGPPPAWAIPALTVGDRIELARLLLATLNDEDRTHAVSLDPEVAAT